MFSEPGSGSDLAALATRATRTGETWRITGQKVWTSLGHLADYGLLLARTDPSVPKHRGLSAFLLPTDAPGVTITPIRTAPGGDDFCEVFLDDVELPAEALLGPVNAGWKVAITVLMNERYALSGMGIPVGSLIELAGRSGVLSDPRVRDDIVDLYSEAQVIRALTARSLEALRQGREPGPEGSVTKLLSAQAAMDLGQAVERLLGADLVEHPRWRDYVLGTLGMKLGGGTEENQKNVIGERVLGLPVVEESTDRTAPWSELFRA